MTLAWIIALVFVVIAVAVVHINAIDDYEQTIECLQAEIRRLEGTDDQAMSDHDAEAGRIVYAKLQDREASEILKTRTPS